MRLIMLGTGPFAVPTLRALIEAGHEIALVVTRPPRGRRQQTSPMHESADELDLPTWSPESVNSPESQAQLTALAADLLVVCDFGEILRRETLAATRLGGINLHGSLLPKYRGAAPVQWAILRGETETGNSVIQMTPGLDAGPCLGQQRVPIDPEEGAERLEARLAKMGGRLVCDVIGQLAAGTAQPDKQDANLASKAPRLTKEQGVVDWSQPALQIKNQVRALRPWPRAYTFWHRDSGPPLRLVIDRAAVIGEEVAESDWSHATSPGTVIRADDRLVIATGDGLLDLLEVQPAGKRSMSAAEFLRGNRVSVGQRFGSE